MPRLAISQMPIKPVEELTGDELIPILSQTNDEEQPLLNMAVRLSDVQTEPVPPEVQLLNLCKEFLDIDGAVLLTPSINYTIPEVGVAIDGSDLLISGFELTANNFVISLPQRKPNLILSIGAINNTSETPITYNINYGNNIQAVPFTQILLENVDYIIINVPSGEENSIIVSILEPFIAEDCNNVDKIVLADDVELNIAINSNEARITQLYNGNFFQEGSVLVEDGLESGYNLRLRLNLAKIARDRVLPESSDPDLSINLNFILSMVGASASGNLSGNLIYTADTKLYSIINQTSLESVPPSIVGLYAAIDDGTITISEVEYDGIYLNFVLQYNSLTEPTFNKFRMSGNIIWFGNSVEPT